MPAQRDLTATKRTIPSDFFEPQRANNKARRAIHQTHFSNPVTCQLAIRATDAQSPPLKSHEPRQQSSCATKLLTSCATTRHFPPPSPPRLTLHAPRQAHCSDTPDLSGTGTCHVDRFTKTKVPGLSIIPDFLSKSEELQVLRFLDSRATQWRTDLSRRTIHYGGTYCLFSPPKSHSTPSASSSKSATNPEIIEALPIPEDLTFIIDRLIEFGCYATLKNRRPEFVIVNEYTSSAHAISAHCENFTFEAPVIGISLGSHDSIRFRELSEPCDGSVRSGRAGRAERSGKVVDVGVPGRSCYVMDRESRWEWQHEVTAKKRAIGFRRVSLTFRVKRAD